MRARDTGMAVQWRSLLGPTAGVLMTLCIVEVALQNDGVRRWLPMPDPYYVPGVEAHRRLLQEFIAREGEPDVVFVGSSVVGSSIVPELFDTHVRKVGGPEVRSFNLWMSGLNPDPVRLYWDRYWRFRCRPRFVLQGVRLAEVCSGQHAEDYERFKVGRVERWWIRKGFGAEVGAWLTEHVGLAYYSGFLGSYLRDMPWPPNGPRGPEMDMRGHPISTRNRVEIVDVGTKYGEGFASERLQVGLAAVSAMAEACRRQGIVYMLVNIPEHRDRYPSGETGQELYSAYLHALNERCVGMGVTMLDVTRGDVNAYGDGEYASDGFHMNDNGAHRFVLEVAEEWCRTVR